MNKKDMFLKIKIIKVMREKIKITKRETKT